MSAHDATLVQLRVYVTGVLAAKLSQVWEMVRNYGDAGVWMGSVYGVKTQTRLLPGQINCQIGTVRLVTFGNSSFVDQLDALDDDRHILKYKLLSHPLNTNPFPGAFLNFRAIIKLHELTRGNGTFMEWTGLFDTEPKDYHIMKQAVTENFEAGFQGLEAIFTVERLPAVPSGPRGRGFSNVTQGVAQMNLRTNAPSHGPPLNRSPRSGPASTISEPAVAQQRTTYESAGSADSLSSSPHVQEGHRPASAGQPMHGWTSEGSGSAIHLSSFPSRLSNEDNNPNQSRRSSQRANPKESVQDRSGFADLGSLPPAFHQQVLHRQAASGPEAGPGPEPRRQGWDPARQYQSDPHPHQMPSTGSEKDPLLKEREDFKAALLAQRYQQSASRAPSQAESSQQGSFVSRGGGRAESDWGQIMQQKDEHMMSLGSSAATTPFAAGHSPHVSATARAAEDLQWVQNMQQRSEDLQEMPAQAGRDRSREDFASMFLPGGAHAPKQNAGGALRKQHSHQSLSSMSQQHSGALDRSAGSTASQAADELVSPPPPLPKTPRHPFCKELEAIGRDGSEREVVPAEKHSA